MRYRFRVLNGCQGRFLILDFTGIPGIQVAVIGNDGGFLPAPHDVMAAGGTIVRAPAQRLDLIVDFAGVSPGRPRPPEHRAERTLRRWWTRPGEHGRPRHHRAAHAVHCRPGDRPDPTTPIANLVLPPVTPAPPETHVRRVALMEHMHCAGDGELPVAAMLGVVEGDPATGTGMAHQVMWMDPVTENPMPGTTEIWEVYNLTVDAHPIHVHETTFEVVDRQEIFVDDESGAISLVPATTMLPQPAESGFLDTVTAEPQQVTRLRMTFGTAGQYVWHCHLVEHEDNEMMRPYRIGPVQPGQPDMPR